MKNLLLLLLSLVAICQLSNAQKMKWGITGGATYSQVRVSDNETKDHTNFTPGFSIGLTGDLALSEHFSLQPSLQYLQKGGEKSGYLFTTQTKITIKLNYLDLPVNFIYHTSGKTGHFIFGAGPSFSYALSGKEKFATDQEKDEENFHFGSSDTTLKRFDMGANVLAGYEWNSGIYLQANFNYGLSNITNTSDDKWKNSYFGLRIGYFFGNNKK